MATQVVASAARWICEMQADKIDVAPRENKIATRRRPRNIECRKDQEGATRNQTRKYLCVE